MFGTLDSGTIGVVWRPTGGQYSLEEYAMTGGPALSSNPAPLQLGSVLGRNALVNGQSMVIVAAEASTLGRLYTVDYSDGTIAPVAQPRPEPRAVSGEILAREDAAWFHYGADSAPWIRAISPVTGVFVGEPIRMHQTELAYTHVWGDYLVGADYEAVRFVPVNEPGGIPTRGRVDIAPPRVVDYAIGMALVAEGADAFIVFKTRGSEGGGPTALHLRKLSYPPSVASP